MSNKINDSQFSEWLYKYYNLHYRTGFFIYLIINSLYIFYDINLAPSLTDFSLIIRIMIGLPLLAIPVFINEKVYRKHFLYINAFSSTVIPMLLIIIIFNFEQNKVILPEVYFSGLVLEILVSSLLIYKWKLAAISTSTITLFYIICNLIIHYNNGNIGIEWESFIFIFLVSLISTFLSYHFQTTKEGMFNSLEELKSERNEIIKMNRTITEQNKKLSENDIAKNKFLSIISHDLKSPIGALMAMTNFLYENKESFSKEELFENTRLMRESSKNIYDLLVNLLEWSRSQQGNIHLNAVDFDLERIVFEVINLLKFNAENKNITIENKIIKNTTLYADPNLITIVMRNLISNAIKYTPKNGKIQIISKINDAVTTYHSFDTIEIEVKDTGVGISPSELIKLFLIEENHSTRGTEDEKGTGLGLILCKEFIEKHHGKIWVKSELNIGSSFYFTLPIVK